MQGEVGGAEERAALTEKHKAPEQNVSSSPDPEAANDSRVLGAYVNMNIDGLQKAGFTHQQCAGRGLMATH